jgi:hypothetical protein
MSHFHTFHYHIGNQRKNFDLYRYDTADYSRELVFQNDSGWQLSALDIEHVKEITD